MILDGPYLQEASDQSPFNIYWAMIGDETGVIRLDEQGDRLLSKLHEGDTIRIIGAWSFADHLQLMYHGIIEKTGELSFTSPDLEKLRRGTKIFPPKKIVTIEQSKVAPKALVKVILHRMHLLDDCTRLFLTIKNMNEKHRKKRSHFINII